MKWTKRVAALLLSLAMVLALAGCGKDESMVLRIGLLGQNEVPEPAMVSTDSEKIVVSHLYENLMKLVPDGEGGTQLVNGQIRSYQCEDDVDGTQTYTFTLRDDIKWSDGQSVTANDFVYAWQHLVDPATKSPNAMLLSVVSGYDSALKKGDTSCLQVQAEDDQTLVVKLNCRCAYFLSAICTSPATMPQRADNPSDGNGAYRIVAQDGNDLRLVKKTNYYDSDRIIPDELNITFCNDSSALSALYKDKELDFALYQPGVGAVDGADFYPCTTALLVNQSAPSLKSESLRQAMSLVIDRNALVGQLGGAYMPADGLVTYGILTEDGSTTFRDANGALIDNDSKHYADNCTAAMAKMTEAGLDNTTALSALGTITLLYEKNDTNDRIANMLQQTWHDKLGVTVTLNAVPAKDMAAALKKGEFTLAMTDVNATYNDATAFLRNFRGTASGNYGHFRASAYNMLLQVAATSSSDEARKAYLEDAERLLLEKGGVIPLYSSLCCHDLRDGLTGLYGNGMGVYYFSSMNEVKN